MEVLDPTTLKKHQELIISVIEARHNKVLEHQRAKFDKLYQQKTDGHSNLTCNYGGGLKL